MITYQEILMGRDKDHPLSREQIYNLFDLLPRLNFLRFHYGHPLTVSSGYRPLHINRQEGGAIRSAHLICQAVDFADQDGKFARWCLDNMDKVRGVGLYLEDPSYSIGWVHLQSRPTHNNPFIPYP
jgi:uncharacterized protein YcbK (DUF882 family)